MSTQFACFVTGTDTEIGKTLVTSALLHALAGTGVRAAGMKPVAAGCEEIDGVLCNEDVDAIAAASNLVLPRELTTPYLLHEPAAPHLVARAEGVEIDIERIAACYAEVARQADAVVVEGVGGFAVPLSDTTDTAHLARRLDLPVILVVGMRLGCLNHALLTAEAIAARGLVLAGWVANSVDTGMRQMAGNLEALERRLPAPLLGYLPRFDHPTAALAAAHCDFTRLPGWPAGSASPAIPSMAAPMTTTS